MEIFLSFTVMACVWRHPSNSPIMVMSLAFDLLPMEKYTLLATNELIKQC